MPASTGLLSSPPFPSSPPTPLEGHTLGPTEAVLCCSLSAVTPVRIKQAQYALNHLSQIPKNLFFSRNESDERGTCAALTLLLGSFKSISGQPDGSFAHLQGDTGTPSPLRKSL